MYIVYEVEAGRLDGDDSEYSPVIDRMAEQKTIAFLSSIPQFLKKKRTANSCFWELDPVTCHCQIAMRLTAPLLHRNT